MARQKRMICAFHALSLAKSSTAQTRRSGRIADPVSCHFR